MPSEEYATFVAFFHHLWPVKLARSFPVLTSQRIGADPSAEANLVPSGEKAADKTAAECPFSSARGLPVVPSQSRAV